MTGLTQFFEIQSLGIHAGCGGEVSLLSCAIRGYRVCALCRGRGIDVMLTTETRPDVVRAFSDRRITYINLPIVTPSP